jgi:signal transduction histidine kinase/CheY-like chemotaxis protein
MAFGLAAALLAGYALARRLSGPIIEVRAAAQRIARGDLAARIRVTTGDEVEALADEFNRMAAQLQEYTGGLERKVEEKTARLQEAMRARELFLAAASHDLRQPLYAISILSDALALKDLPAGAREILGKQRQAIGILRTLFDNLLDLSRFEAGEIRPLLREVSVREVLNPLAVEHEVMSHAKGLAWHCDLPDVWIRTDPELLRRLVGNLLSNAVRYTNAGSVRLEALAGDSTVTFTVSDTGIGIAPEQHARVFEEFVQLDNPSRERERGVGLGLSIVRKIDTLLGARLTLQSSPGEGTRVSFELPVAEVRAEPVAASEPAAAAASNLPGARIWVVEDDAMVRSAISAQLDSWAVDHDFATSREEILALREADGEWPGAVLLDDMLGQKSEGGLELARWLNEYMARDRITLVTGNVEPERVRELQESGFRVLRKPVSSAELAQALGESLEPARAARAAVRAG